MMISILPNKRRWQLKGLTFTLLISSVISNACLNEASQIKSIATFQISSLTELEEGDEFRMSPEHDPGQCIMPGRFGVTHQVCGPLALWRVEKTYKVDSETYALKIASLENGNCLTVANQAGIVKAYTETCSNQPSQKVFTIANVFRSEANPDKNSDLSRLTFYKKDPARTQSSAFYQSKLLGSGGDMTERSHIYDSRVPPIIEVAVVKSDSGDSISGIEFLRSDGGREILGTCILDNEGKCLVSQSGHRKRLNLSNNEVLTDMAFKFNGDSIAANLVGVKVTFATDPSGPSQELLSVDFQSESSPFFPSDNKTDFVSEEDYLNLNGLNRKAECPDGAIVGLHCQGPNCDNVAAFCSKPVVKIEEKWITDKFISDEKSSYVSQSEKWCPDFNSVITGIRCLKGDVKEAGKSFYHPGQYCDNIEIRCAKIKGFDSRKPQHRQCFWTDDRNEWLTSESRHQNHAEPGIYYDQNLKNTFLVGMKCDGSFCARKSLHFCSWPEDAITSSDWQTLSASISADMNIGSNLNILAGLSVNFDHPRTSKELATIKQTFDPGVDEYQNTYATLQRKDAAIKSVKGIFVDPSVYARFFNDAIQRAEGNQTYIVQAKNEEIGIPFQLTQEHESLNDLLTLQMFRFSTSLAEHEPFVQTSNASSVANQSLQYPKIRSLRVCSFKGKLAALEVFYDQENSYGYLIGDTKTCRNTDPKYKWDQIDLQEGETIIRVSWKPSISSNNNQGAIAALKFETDQGKVYETGSLNEGKEQGWSLAFQKDCYGINGFQGAANRYQGLGAVLKKEKIQDQRKESYLPSLSKEIEQDGFFGIMRLSPIYLKKCI